MKIVLDTNVLASGVSGFRQPSSTPARLLSLWRDGIFDLVISSPIVEELSRTLSKPYFQQHITAEQVDRAIMLLHARAVLTLVGTDVQGVATHPEDDVMLATAISGGVDYLVTGDRRLREVGSIEGIAILSPREFLDLLTSEDPPSS
jgi:putative PIN family toxin of toxin-antitoxin system